jgi:hypothetical protein
MNECARVNPNDQTVDILVDKKKRRQKMSTKKTLKMLLLLTANDKKSGKRKKNWNKTFVSTNNPGAAFSPSFCRNR